MNGLLLKLSCLDLVSFKIESFLALLSFPFELRFNDDPFLNNATLKLN